MIGCATAIAAWLSGAGRLWLAAGVLIGSVVPFTLLVIQPVNDVLRQGDPAAMDVGALLRRWGYLHWVRTVVSGFSFLTCLLAIFRRAV